MNRAITLTGSVLLMVILVNLTGLPVAAQLTRAPAASQRLCAVGQCLDVVQGRCTGEPCGAGIPCASPNQRCELTGRFCPCGSAGTPTATPTPQCESVPCGGSCVIGPHCHAGIRCPEVPVRPGQCQQVTAANHCECLPVPIPTATPTATPTPQCESVPCQGSCVLSFPCLPGQACSSAVRLGQCQVTTAGSCNCLPFPTSTPRPSRTPTATKTPQCVGAGASCGGPCVLSSPCPPGHFCPDVVRRGQCQFTAAGRCGCLPFPTPTPRWQQTPTATSAR
jgi:hypothetical protein